MSTNYLEKLEYNKILNILSTFSVTYIGKQMCTNLIPSYKDYEVKILLSETKQALNLLYRNNTPPIYEIANNSINIKTLESSGVLSIKAILDVSNIFKMSSNLKNYFNKEYITSEEYPQLNNIFSNLYTNNSILEKVDKSIIDENTISDTATSTLNSIRKKQRKIEQDIKSKLNNFIHSPSYSKYIQENVITIRNNRYVIPVKEEYRTQIKGFIHDTSSSGSTIFIEPITVFDLNNELSNLKIDEQVEIEKILQDLSKIFYPYTEELKTNIELIGKLDFIFSKAKYSKSINATTPIISSNKKIILKNATHPLLNRETAVPISIELGNNFSTLVITGPNTGGKTVTLKTVGLLTCMACSGLNIPAAENSSIYVFDNIFADIGDDQSISDSLSTFSSHMKNIVDITRKCTSNSLILVDELGSGTDPVEGSALAISILDYFQKKGSLTIATTHYQEIKKFALITDEFENASVEFDINTLSPTYRLLIGVPGKSNAFEISKKLGLEDNIILNAKSNIDSKDFEFEELLKSIYNDKSEIEKQKLELSKQLNKISKLKTDLERDNSELLSQEKEIINNAKIEARNILLDAKKEANLIISKLNKTSLNGKDINTLRDNINSKIKNISIESNIEEPHSSTIQKEDLKPNTQVYITTLGQNGIVLSNVSKSDEVQIQIGSMKMNINIKYLQKIQNQNNTKSKSTIHANISKTRTATSEINVIGQNVEEALFMVDKFLDDSILAKLQTIRIVHGKGTGKLREEIQKFLKKHSQVKSFRIGTYGEGEMGVTVVELK